MKISNRLIIVDFCFVRVSKLIINDLYGTRYSHKFPKCQRSVDPLAISLNRMKQLLMFEKKDKLVRYS